MLRSSRVAAGALALVLPVAAVAGCGAEKKRTVRAEFSAAGENLQASRSASFTVGVQDAKGNLARLITDEGDLDKALATALSGDSITYVVDPVGDKTLGDVQGGTSTDLSKSFEDLNLAFVVRDDEADVLEVRVVDSVAYLHVDLDEVERLATAGGVEDFDASLDEAVAEGPDGLADLLADVRKGKWVKVDLSPYLDDLQDLTGGLSQPTPGSSFDPAGLGQQLLAAVKPHVTVKDANDSSSDRVLDVEVDARPAIRAALKVLEGSKDLPFGEVLAVDPAEVDRHVGPGKARGQVRLSDGHLEQVSIDVESLRLLAKDADTKTLAGLRAVLDVDDSADEVEAPEDVSDTDLGDLFSSLLEDVTGSEQTA